MCCSKIIRPLEVNPHHIIFYKKAKKFPTEIKYSLAGNSVTWWLVFKKMNDWIFITEDLP